MREILFRGKRLDNGDWIEGSFLDGSFFCENYALICPKMTFSERGEGGISCGGFVFVDPSTIGQYTGLTDKNGVRIFEGDIIHDTGDCASNEPGIIEWSSNKDEFTYHSGFRVVWQEKVPRRSHLSFWAKEREIEVIGNIHDKKGDNNHDQD